jgi:chemotaxis protein CheX
MKVEIVNPFISASVKILEIHGNKNITKGTLSLVKSPVPGKDINTVIGVTGDVSGQVIYCMSSETAKQIASLMLMNLPIDDFDYLAQSAINELGNIITGNAATDLFKNGYFCKITPPSLIIGDSISVSIKDLQIISVPLATDFGDLLIYVALREEKAG